MEAWLVENWKWMLAGFFILEKIVYLTPNKYDDIVISIIKGAIKKLAGKD